MVKKNASKQAKQGQIPVVPLAILAVVLVAVVGVFTVFNNGGAATSTETVTDGSSPQLISPANYNADFLDASADHILIDVRTPGEFSGGHIEGAININVEEIAQRLDEIPTDKLVILYCRSGNRSARAASILDSAGFEGIYDLGGIQGWSRAGYPVVQ